MVEKFLNTRIIHKHDLESNWLKATNFIPKQGEIIIYDIDDNYVYERIKVGDGIKNVNELSFVDNHIKVAIESLETSINSTNVLVQNYLPKITNITIGTAWQGSTSPYYQDIELSCVTDNSMVDIQPTAEQLASWQNDGLAFTTLSYAGIVRVYVAGGKPTDSITVQVKVQEVTVL